MGDIERGVIPDPHFSSLSKIAKGLGISIGELLEEPSSPKALAPTSSAKPSSSSAATEAGRQPGESQALESFGALYWYVERRVAMYEEDIKILKYEEDIKILNSLHFANLTAAANWVSTVNREAFMLSKLVQAQVKPLLESVASEESRKTTKYRVQRIAQLLMYLVEVSEWAQKRLTNKLSPVNIASEQHFDMTKPQHFDMTKPRRWADMTRRRAQALQAAAQEI